MPHQLSRRVRVVIAEDHHTVRQELCHLIDGHPELELVGQAANGLEAVALARALRPAVIIIDARMPLLDGIEAARRIGADLPDVAVVGMSSRAWSGAPDPFAGTGAAAYFEKGDDAATLIARVLATAGRR